MEKIANYHTHTYLCKHATGTPLDYVRQAEKDGCRELGFSDHCPYPATFEDVWPGVRMEESQVPLYKKLIAEARQAAPFPVYWGFECEYDERYKHYYGDTLLGSFGAQYLALGPHWVTDGSSHIGAPDITDNALLNRYIDQIIAGLSTGFFAFLAHPDLFMMGHREWDSQAQSCLMALLDAAVDLDIPIEINGLGMSRTPIETSRGIRYPYPYQEFWECAAQTNVRVICNSDAHKSQDVIFNAWKARDFAGRFGLAPIATLETLHLQNHQP